MLLRRLKCLLIMSAYGLASHHTSDLERASRSNCQNPAHDFLTGPFVYFPAFQNP